MMDEARIRILIADPHSAADGALDLFLGERGFQVTRCVDGRTALDAPELTKQVDQSKAETDPAKRKAMFEAIVSSERS